MLPFLKRLMLVAAVALVLARDASGFALLGPRDTWQISPLGYDPQADGGDLGGPKNIGEEWRQVIPVITYGFDESFLSFFGTNGMNAAISAFEAFNRETTNFSALTFTQLRGKPRETRRVHLTAQAIGLLDLKSQTMALIAEQLGLASAERFTWALRSRGTPGPNITNYFVVQRNFDPFTYSPTPYVNGVRYSYQVKQYPARFYGADFESTSVFPVDQSLGERRATLSSATGEDFTSNPPLLYLPTGVYYSGLTQDDIGGLKYIYQRENVNTEDVLAGTTNRVVDLRSITYLQAIDAYSFFTNAVLTTPSNLISQFPALNFSLRTNTVFGLATNLVSTNVVLTNLVSTGPFTDYSQLILLTNLDLFTFSEASKTNAGPALLALAPGLVISSTNSYPALVTNEVYYLTNYPWMPVGSAPIVATNKVTGIETRYNYTYANIRTNYASSVTKLRVDTFYFTGTAFVTNTVTFNTNLTSGGFYVVDRRANPNLIDYSFTAKDGTPLLRVTNVVAVTNITIFTNVIKQVVNYFTNVVYAAYPTVLNATTGTTIRQTNFVATPVTNFTYTLADFVSPDQFGNPAHVQVIPAPTNLLARIAPSVSDANSQILIQTIDFTDPINPVISTNIVGSRFPLGAVLIYDPNQFQLSGDPPIFTSGLTTNVITTFTDANGRSFTQLMIYQTNSALIPAHPVIFQSAAGALQRAGMNSIKFMQIPYTNFLSQTNATFTNNFTQTIFRDGQFVTENFQRISGPDILLTAGDLGTTVGGFPIVYFRSIGYQAGQQIILPPAQFNGGPGIILPGQTFQFSKVIPYNFNQNPNFTSEENANVFFAWGSFDARTITPRIYPEDLNTQVTLQLLEALALTGRAP